MRHTLLACLFSLLLLACCGSSANTHGVDLADTTSHFKQVTNPDTLAAPERRDGAEDTVRQWLVTTNATNEAQIDEVTGFLHSFTNKEPKKYLRSDGIFLFWVADMTEAQKGEVLNHEYVEWVEPNLKFGRARVTPTRSSPKNQRDVQYETQYLAPTELASISQPRYAHLNPTSCHSQSP
jgi:hypothetical protein